MSTQVYTFEINMLVQVLAESKEEAEEKVNREGGYLNTDDRNVKLVAVTNLVTPVKLESVTKLSKKQTTK